jgi:hypothetical protein
MNSERTRTGSNDAERQFLTRAQHMFREYPELLSFWIEEESDSFDDLPWSEAQHARLDLHVALATDVSEDFQQELCLAVTHFLTEVLADHPETLEVLLGRTFARTLH